jgi:hypothetical protein
MMRRALVSTCLSVMVGCSSSTEPLDGTEGGPCYPNRTCNEGLVCLSHTCVRPPAPDASSGDGPVLPDVRIDRDTGIARDVRDSGGGPKVLFKDDFSGSFPAPSWTNVTSTSVDDAMGNPPPSLMIGDGTGTGHARTVATFSTSGGLTISFDLRSGTGTAWTVSLVDISNPKYDTQLTNGICRIAGAYTGFGAPQDKQWHRYTFEVVKGGATWSRDGAIILTHAYTVGAVYVQMSGTRGTAASEYVSFDNLLITSP